VESEGEKEPDSRLIDILIEVRTMARREKRFDIADFIRSRLEEIGVEIEDTPAGTKWKRK